MSNQSWSARDFTRDLGKPLFLVNPQITGSLLYIRAHHARAVGWPNTPCQEDYLKSPEFAVSKHRKNTNIRTSDKNIMLNYATEDKTGPILRDDTGPGGSSCVVMATGGLDGPVLRDDTGPGGSSCVVMANGGINGPVLRDDTGPGGSSCTSPSSPLTPFHPFPDYGCLWTGADLDRHYYVNYYNTTTIHEIWREQPCARNDVLEFSLCGGAWGWGRMEWIVRFDGHCNEAGFTNY